MINLVNDEEVMGKHTNNKLQNLIARSTVLLIVALTLAAFIGIFI
jgi:Mn2+/Fe2+ NRAMP family transporter